MISMIVAVDKNLCIGKDNTLPFSIKEDMKWFKEKTIGKTIVMGRKTLESIGKPLPNRNNIILSRDTALEVEGAVVLNDYNEVIKRALLYGEQIVIIGGSEIYNLFLPYAHKLYVTLIDTEVEDGDTYFPEFINNYECINIKDKTDKEHELEYFFSIWERK